MRKIIPIMLALVLILSMGLSSAAAKTMEENSHPVTAVYVPGEEGGQVINVEIEWSGMDFTYSGASNPVWDATKHQYESGNDGGWAKSDAYITITNHSNVMLQSIIDYSQNAGYESMELKFTDVSPYIGSAETSDGEGKECTVIIRAIPMGTLKSDTQTSTEVGEIKISMVPVTNHNTVLSAIGDLYAEIPVNSGRNTIARGDLYYTDTEVMQQVAESHTVALNAMQETSDPARNLALNKLITDYYNNLYLMQD